MQNNYNKLNLITLSQIITLHVNTT